MVLFDQMGIVGAYVWLSGFTEERNELFLRHGCLCTKRDV